MLNVLYLVHDLADPATLRRVAMLRAGGAEVALAGFRRTEQPVRAIDGVRPIDLGATEDGKFAQRLVAVAKAAIGLAGAFRVLARPDVIIARNLEMLALAHRANALFGAAIPIVYECLDIHRLLLRKGSVGAAMRAAERRLGRSAGLLITSSPAFLREYFLPYGQIAAPALLLHNKVLELDGFQAPTAPAQVPAAGQPWKIGWFGALRCRRSLELLSTFTRRMEGRFEVVLRGRPARSEFADFDAAVAAEPFIRFEGPYRNPDDLAAIYGEVHFTWAIDFFEEGFNSTWLLPNRLYEGCRHGVVPIAMRQTETGRFLLERGIGLLLLEEATADAVEALVADIDSETYAAEQRRVTSRPSETWVCDRDDCRALIARLAGLSRPAMTARTVESMA